MIPGAAATKRTMVAPASPFPLFPLPNVLLYPEAMLPLHVFEPRFVQLVEDLQAAGGGELVLGLLRPGWEESYFENPPVHEMAGLGRVLQCNRMADGRYNILVRGVRRVRIREEPPSGRLYRTVRVEETAEIAPADLREAVRLRLALRDGLVEFAEGSLLLPRQAPLGYLADVLTVALPLDIEHKQELFSTLDVAERARRVLAELCAVNERRRSFLAASQRSSLRPSSN